VKHITVDGQEHGLQRGGSDVYAKKQRPIHDSIRMVTKDGRRLAAAGP
jgi:hypothetical protein